MVRKLLKSWEAGYLENCLGEAAFSQGSGCLFVGDISDCSYHVYPTKVICKFHPSNQTYLIDPTNREYLEMYGGEKHSWVF